MHDPRRRLGWLALILLLAGCTAAQPATDGAPGTAAPAQPVKQRALVTAFQREAPALESSMLPQPRNESGLVTAFLAIIDEHQQAHPYLAAELPSIDKGTWKINPDGTMETTYTLKPNATWHDGQPLTADDFVFAHDVRLDPDFPAFTTDVERRISRATAVDAHTLLLEWKESYLWAGMIFLPNFSPMPKHLLEQLYQDNKDAFLNGPQWREQYIHAGPYRVVRWDPGVELQLAAFPDFVLGPPAIPEIRVKFITDPNTIVANMLGGNIDVGFSTSIGFPQAQALEQASWHGKVEYWLGNPRIVQFQAREWPGVQKAVLDARVRHGLLRAVDRQAIVDGVFAGRGRVAYFWLHPSDPSFPAVDAVVPKDVYDPARAEALLRDAGWVKGADGLARNADGDVLSVPINNQPGDQEQQEGAILADYWKQAGVTADVHQVTPQELRDGEMRSKYPGMAYERRNMGTDNMIWTSFQVSRPENRWTGSNRNGYTNPVLDDLWKQVLAAVDQKEQEKLLIQAITVMQDDAYVTLTHLQPEVMCYDSSLTGPIEASILGTSPTWNVYQWHWTN